MVVDSFYPAPPCTISRFSLYVRVIGREEPSTAVLSDNTVLLMGGYGGSSLFNDVWKTVDGGARWTLVTASAEWAGTHPSIITRITYLMLVCSFTLLFEPLCLLCSPLSLTFIHYIFLDFGFDILARNISPSSFFDSGGCWRIIDAPFHPYSSLFAR